MAAYDIPTNPTPSVLKAIIARLQNRPALNGVRITRHDFNTSKHGDSIFLIDGSDAPTYGALGRMRVKHDMAIRCEIWAVRPGNTDEVADEVTDRAYAIHRELELEFRGSDQGAQLIGLDGAPLAKLVTVGQHNWNLGTMTTQMAFMIELTLNVTMDTTRL